MRKMESPEGVWEQVKNKEKCDQCPFKHLEEPPLIIKPLKPQKVRVMTITEGPNRREDIRVLTSIANQPTFTFLFTLFNGKFRPCGLTASVYWTHVRKCFIDGSIKDGREALKVCSEAYLKDEIESMKPKLIVSVGTEALRFLAKYDRRLRGNLTSVFLRQARDVYGNVKIGYLNFDVAVVPHPSGLNRFWNKPPQGTLRVFETIQKRLSEIIY